MDEKDVGRERVSKWSVEVEIQPPQKNIFVSAFFLVNW